MRRAASAATALATSARPTASPAKSSRGTDASFNVPMLSANERKIILPTMRPSGMPMITGAEVNAVACQCTARLIHRLSAPIDRRMAMSLRRFCTDVTIT